MTLSLQCYQLSSQASYNLNRKKVFPLEKYQKIRVPIGIHDFNITAIDIIVFWFHKNSQPGDPLLQVNFLQLF